MPAARHSPNAKYPKNCPADLSPSFSPRFESENNPHLFIIHGSPRIIGAQRSLS